MTQQVFEYLKRVEWLPAQNQIPRWRDRGIHHGFEGLDHELPPFGLHLKQVHSVTIQEITESGTQGLAGQGDVLATKLATHRIAVKTADCVPVLLHHPEMVMAIHAGWRGLAQDILGKVADFVSSKGYDPRECDWGIGPAISSNSFEIGPEVLEHFNASPVYQTDVAYTVQKGVHDRWHLDLQSLAVLRLGRIGVAPERVSVIRTDTKTNPELWHSYRRNGEQAGRNWTWIEHGSAGLSSLGLV
ncbi:MAG: polyphenol oxidase family protein [Bdellovibrionota bacterium]|nr:MAG: laccase domain-containing protein [Pseudomonadota bacterium]